jgi:hypothetical protein
MKSSFGAPNFPANLPASWDTLFGKFYPAHPVIAGEWGGRYGNGSGGQMDVTWQNAFVQYLIGKGISDSFFWCYTPNSGDTGGILDDNLQVRTDKMALIRKLWAGSTTTPPPAGALAFKSGSYALNQTAGAIALTVNRASGSNGAISVSYATANGTATSGRDYTAASGTLSWASGDTSAKTISIPVSAATPFAGTRAFSVRLTSPTSGATLGTPGTATITINGTANGVMRFDASAYSVNQSAGTITVQVRRIGGSTGAVSVQYATANGSATSARDYTARNGTLSWIAGDATAKTFTVPINRLVLFGGTRTFGVNLSAPTGGSLMGNPGSATITISGGL